MVGGLNPLALDSYERVLMDLAREEPVWALRHDLSQPKWSTPPVRRLVRLGLLKWTGGYAPNAPGAWEYEITEKGRAVAAALFPPAEW